MSYQIHTTDNTFFSLEELDNQIAKVWQKIDNLDAREPWNVVLREQLSQEINLLQGQYSTAKRRADGSAQRDSVSFSSPRKRQMLSDEEYARELDQRWNDTSNKARQDSIVRRDEEMAWRLYQDEQGSNKRAREEGYQPPATQLTPPLRLRQSPTVQQAAQALTAPLLPPLTHTHWDDPEEIMDDDSAVEYFADDFDEEKIREILAQDNLEASQLDPWYIDESKQAKINDFFKMYGIDNNPIILDTSLPPIDWTYIPDPVLSDPLAMPDPLANMPVEQQVDEEFELVDSQFDWGNVTLPPLNLPQNPPQLLIEDGALMLNENRPMPIHNPQINQYIDYVRHDPTKTVDEIKKLLENIRPDMDIPPENREGTPEALVYPLMEHQKLGLAWMKAMEEGSNKGGILADDMGLGKTIQTIALIVSRPSSDPKCKTNLIIAPLSLLKQWEREIQKKLKPGKFQLSVYIHHGNGKKHKTFQELTRYDVVLTTFGTLAAEYRKRVAELDRLRDKLDEFEALESGFIFTGRYSKWYRVLIDEAQCIKNKDTLSARGCSQLIAHYRFCLSGTPMQNRCEEIYSLIRFLRIKPYDDYPTFNKDFGIPFRSKSNWQIKEAMPKFQALLKALLLRRTKASQIDGKPILTLPPKTIETKHCVFSQEEQEFYSALRNKTMIQFNKYLRANAIGKNYSNILVLLLRLRQAACHPHLINDIEHNAGEVEAGQMVELAKGLSMAVVTRLKETGIEECPICMDTSNNPSIVLPCGHAFCTDCIIQVHATAAQQNLRLRGEENDGARCPGCRGALDIKKMIDWTAFKKVHIKEEDDAEEVTTGKLTTEALAKLRRDARTSAASKKDYIDYLESNWMTSSKIENCLEILDGIIQKDRTEKTIIFSQWTSMLDLLEVPIFRKGWKYRRYDGSMTSTERNDAILEFTDDPEINIMLISMKAGNSGLNLVAASQIILFDPCYNPFIESQAIDRAHRIGQQRPVVVHKLCTQGTVENEILDLQEEKMSVIGNALDETASRGIGRLSTKDLGRLFGYGEAEMRGMGIRG